MSDRTYFLVEPNSPVLAIIRAAEEKHQAYYKAAGEFAAEFGTDRWYATTNFSIHDVLGLAFEKGAPEGWRLNKKKGYSTPDTRAKLGKDIAKRMRELPQGVAAATFSGMLDEAFKGESKQSYQVWGEGCSLSWTASRSSPGKRMAACEC
jgi:hypothetical protein